MNKKERFLWLIFPSLGVLILMTVFLGVITKGSQIINADGDLALHVAVGNYILDTGKIPLEDVFSHTMNGLPYTPHEWLSEVLFAISNRIMGLDGAILLTALVISFAFWLTYKNSSRGSGSFFALLFFFIFGYSRISNPLVGPSSHLYLSSAGSLVDCIGKNKERAE